MNLLIMGLPGAGKGTQAAKIVEEFHVAHISTGDMFLVDLGLELEGVINIEVDPSCLLERLSGRIIHRETGETYHKVFNPPADYKEEDYYQREDDKPETVKRRLDVNIAQGEPILAHYREKGLVHDIEGNQDINDVFKDIQKVLENLK